MLLIYIIIYENNYEGVVNKINAFFNKAVIDHMFKDYICTCGIDKEVSHLFPSRIFFGNIADY